MDMLRRIAAYTLSLLLVAAAGYLVAVAMARTAPMAALRGAMPVMPPPGACGDWEPLLHYIGAAVLLGASLEVFRTFVED